MSAPQTAGVEERAAHTGLLAAVVLLVYLGQMALMPVLAPLAREVGLTEWQIGMMISVAAVMVVVTSQFWGRRALSHGARRVLAMAVVMAAGSLALFGVAGAAGLAGALGGTTLFVLFVLLRGLVFGSAVAAVFPTAQTYITKVTTSESARVRALAGLGAAQGMSMILGATLGGILAAFGLITVLAVVPLVVALAFIAVLRLPRDPAGALVEAPPRIRPTDPRVWPFLVAGFGMFTALGFIQILTGFLIADRFGLSPERTGLATGGAILLAGIGMVVAQAVIVPKVNWSPVRLLRVGSAIALVGFVLLAPAATAALFGAAIGLIGLGLGIAMPGYTAGPTLLMRPEEQGGLAGLIGATNGLTFVVAPTLATSLYSVRPLLPVLLGAAMMALVVVFVMLHPRLRAVAHSG